MSAWNKLLVLGQGLWVRRRLEALPPASGPSVGLTVPADVQTPTARLGVLGDSTAAGCGVETHDASLVGALARALATRTKRPVRWHVVGEYGATGRRIRHRLVPRLEGEYDVVVILAGTNDVLADRTPSDWHDDLTAILGLVLSRSQKVVVAGTPPLESFPSLPRRLGQHLAARARVLDRVTHEICASTPGATFVQSDPALIDPRFFARDRFHPSAHGYSLWAESLVDAVVPEWID